MSDTTDLRGHCPAPFYERSKFTDTSGYIPGRFCAAPFSTQPDLYCCLPCPASDWIYPHSFKTWDKAAGYLNIACLLATLFLLISFIILPVENTKRHYLNVSLLIGVMFIQIGFIIPMPSRPPQCHNEITPNDMHTSLSCAWSGAFIICGGLIADVWVFMRALAMHLHICWDVAPGRRFFFASHLIGWGIIAIIFSVTISTTGVSFRLGSSCHVNSAHSMADFWSFVIAFAAISTLLQSATLIYCLKIYLRNLWSDDGDTRSSGTGLPSYTASARKKSKAHAVYRRVSTVFILQWRSILVVTVILMDVIVFAVVFIWLDRTQDKILADFDSLRPWLICLVFNNGEADKCLNVIGSVVVPFPIICLVLILFSVTGLQLLLLLVRWPIFEGWWNVIRFGTRGGSQGEFVSFDARRVPSNARRFEVIKVGPPTLVTTRSSNSAPPVPPGDVRAISPRTTSSTSSEGSLPHGSLPSPQEPREFVTSFGSLPTVTEFTISDAGSMVGDETDSSPPQLTEYESSEFSPEKISVREISPRSPHIVRTPPGLLWPSAGSQHRSTSDISMAASASVSPPPAIIGTSTAAGLVGGGGGGGGRGRSAPNSSVFPGTLSPSGARMFGSNGTTFTPSIASRTATPMRSVSGPGPRSAVVSPLSIVTNAPLDASGRASDSHFAGVEREYRSPPMSFSTPRTDGIPRAMMAGSLQNEMSRRISASVAAAAASDALLAESTQDGLAGAGVTDGVTERASTPLPSPPSNMPPLQSSFSPDSDGHGSQLDLAAAKYELEREHVMRDYEEQLLRHSKDLEDLKRADEHESSIPYDKV